MEQIYYGVALVVYGIFIIRFMLSWIGGDFEIDADLDISDVVSFKGITHFLMGLSGWLSAKSFVVNGVAWYDYIIGSIIGFIFVIILFYLYKFMFKLEHKPTILTGKDLVGTSGTVYIINKTNDSYTVTVSNGNGTVEVQGTSVKPLVIGDRVLLSDYNGVYYTLLK